MNLCFDQNSKAIVTLSIASIRESIKNWVLRVWVAKTFDFLTHDFAMSCIFLGGFWRFGKKNWDLKNKFSRKQFQID